MECSACLFDLKLFVTVVMVVQDASLQVNNPALLLAV